ncbi:primosomal protein N' [Diaminobutyricimonas sp. TR449]|uniref:primosomal protein N' family DNA-binding protein n=1 Tax=Diaminobutyricimonas sp. TR449 TaxID=2708076 RepID=UPI00141F0C6A|nr:primosomal protein N' [Diaminobutyricimonas sp. TR449]
MPAASIARVLIDSPLPQLDRLFDYRVPEKFAEDAKPGVRVKVPLRSVGRIADGFIVELTDSVDYTGPLSDLDQVVSAVPILAPEVWAVARKVADRAAGTASDVVRVAVPTRQVRVEKSWLARAEAPGLPPVVAREITGYDAGLAELIAAGGRAAVAAVPRVIQTTAGTWVGHWALSMAEAAATSIAAGKSAILAVPDYRDQRQLAAALAEVLPAERIVHLDARQSNPDRYRALLRCLGDEPLAIIGNRSVVYAPAAELGLIALWDDGDPLFAEPLAPYVHARDAALVRQEQQGSALLCFGHARSTEVERLVEVGWLSDIHPQRITSPKVVPTAQQRADDRLAAQARIPSSAWRAARAGLDDGPVLVQVARPGYAPRVACESCRQTARCGRCEGPLAMRQAGTAPACSWCGALAIDWNCTHCGGTRFRLVGSGSARTAEDLGRAFPGMRVIIADGDHPVLEVDERPALVIATRGAEPIAAGGYRAILLLDGEQMLARESLRVGEDCLRWWANAASLAAPGAPAVLVGVGGALATAMATWRLADYTRSELADRRRLRFPPAVRVATVTGAPDAVATAVGALEATGIDVLGPVELPDGVVRGIIRFDYAAGATVAATLRSEVIRAATNRRRAAAGRGGRGPLKPPFRVRFDDVEPFAD